MSDLKLFRTNDDQVTELEGRSASVEKSIQTLVESHQEAFLGVRFLATEYDTGSRHGGRMDTIGLDENGSASSRSSGDRCRARSCSTLTSTRTACSARTRVA